MATDVQETDTDVVTDDDGDIVAAPDPMRDLEFDEEDDDDINVDDIGQEGKKFNNFWFLCN